jgi:two-component system response regulator YesN
MKALIIDDEKHVREAIRLLVPWEHFGIHEVLEAIDGQAAISLIEAEQPAIIFTDMMMPNMGGVELLEWAAQFAPASKIIVISGHDDFDFVRQTVKFGGMDYLLKPIDENQLLHALTKAINGWNNDEEARSRDRNRNMEINQLKPVYLDKFFSTMLSEPCKYTTVQEELQLHFDIDHTVQHALLCVLNLDIVPPFIRKKYAAAWDLLFFTLTNICNEILRIRSSGYAFRYWGQENEIVILLWKDMDLAEKVLTEINEGIYLALRTRLSFGIGSLILFPSQIQLSYRQARKAVHLRNLRHTRNEIAVHTGEKPSSKNAVFFTDYEQRIRYAVQSGDKEQLHTAFDAWFKAMEQSEVITLEQLNLWMQEFRLAQTMWMNEVPSQLPLSSQAPLPSVIDDLGAFTLAEWKPYFIQEALVVLNLLAEGPGKNQSSMQAIAKYVEQFLHEELSLQDISNRFFLSREYISRKFKQEMDENLTDYITRMRVQRAKSLLADSPLKMTQISELVGFQDEKYFSKVFKKWTDCSPNEYRKQAHGKSKGG